MINKIWKINKRNKFKYCMIRNQNMCKTCRKNNLNNNNNNY